ncbi:glycosyltransferase [Pantoea anthophila]|uniref:glycosyltransferase n=1 Tax=Pantoea anthophila TaxID=470931 RepID=UPI0027810AD4|nr:glycosyltransferase [Pantoea anthophila]MDQ1213664.1 UDP-D-galactose:(glucosyl)LPS alpha-1,6-D-galactosyltransferase [Pantoea anthophila]
MKNNNIRKQRIVLVTDLMAGRGGMENVTGQLITALNAEAGTEAGLFIINSGEESHSRAWTANAVLAESVCTLRNKKIKNLIHTLRMAAFFRRYQPDHVLTLNTIPCLMTRRAISLSGRKIMLSSWMHLPPRERYRPHYLLRADHHFAISQQIKQQLVDLGAREADVDVIYNPVKRTEVVIGRPQGLKFLYIGRIHFRRQKQLKDLFDALQQVSVPWTLEMVGDGEDLAQCQHYAAQLGIADRITWHGWQENAWEYVLHQIRQVSCLLMTSNFEGFPLILLEAMSRGVYCVSSDCISGPAEIIQNGHNGQLYPVNDSMALAAILNAMSGDFRFPDHQVIKASITGFYEENYMKHLMTVLNRLTEVKHDE